MVSQDLENGTQFRSFYVVDANAVLPICQAGGESVELEQVDILESSSCERRLRWVQLYIICKIKGPSVV
jgi:hypothetical protein